MAADSSISAARSRAAAAESRASGLECCTTRTATERARMRSSPRHRVTGPRVCITDSSWYRPSSMVLIGSVSGPGGGIGPVSSGGCGEDAGTAMVSAPRVELLVTSSLTSANGGRLCPSTTVPPSSPARPAVVAGCGLFSVRVSGLAIGDCTSRDWDQCADREPNRPRTVVTSAAISASRILTIAVR